MSVTLVTQPDTVEQSGSFLNVAAASDNEYAQAGEYYQEYLRFSALPNTFQQIEFIWNNGETSITVLFNTSYSNGNFTVKLPGGLIGTNLSTWIENSAIPDFQNIKQLTDDFTFSFATPDKILVKAKNKGAKYDVQITHSTTAITQQAKVTGVDAIRRSNFTIPISIFYSHFLSNTFNEIEYLPHPIANKVHIDIADELKHQHTSLWPSPGGTQSQDVSKMVLKYFIRYGEAYGSPLQYFQQTKTATKYLLPGGRSKTDIRKNGSFLSSLNGMAKWLTHRSTRKVSPTEPIYLYYMPLATATQNRVRAKLFFTDGTTQNMEPANLNVQAYSLWMIKIGLQEFASSVQQGKVITSWSVTVYNSNLTTALSNTAFFELDQSKNIDEIHILYRNSFGVPDVYRFTGEVGHFTNFNKTAANLYVDTPTADTDRTQVHTESYYQKSIEINTQYFEKQEQDQLIDFLNSKDYFLLLSDGEKVPVTISAGTLGNHTSNSGRRNAHTFTINLDPEKYA
ncbi:hypothetical protein Oweho_3192 [Owenweeksia hongkongensis DSM 17368]|uniref:Uncharacterized protein n=1 Tax=Owenweeksia hongkongensis (strain DSM 17368 / CIP 108786 / JCM 12287 / NRRL B-23963 / UST20020801) TaxID=926562 RepID=G8R3Q6_OWEHD|nr:hypothetical protein [Owenweeksia hongkongensis]AEV34143.1 hypothetical protein Oweho_3192 [Owenweeksia hongkongensis DSM 17368]